MDRYKVLALGFGGFSLGVIWTAACDGKGGPLGEAEAAESDCSNWSYYMDTEYDTAKCDDAGDPCIAPAGWEPVSTFHGYNADGQGADLVLMRKCGD